MTRIINTYDQLLAAKLFCSACKAFHPRNCFHRDRSKTRGYRYTCRMHRHDTRPSEAVPCPKCGGKAGPAWHHQCSATAQPPTKQHDEHCHERKRDR